MPPSLCLKYKCAVSPNPLPPSLGHVAEQTSAELEQREAVSQQTDGWIHLCLLYKQTGTRNVNQSFNSNLARPVVTYIIINHPCQLAHTNCWVQAINTWTLFLFLSLFFSPYIFLPPPQAGTWFHFYFSAEELWLDASHWHTGSVIWARDKHQR